MDRRGVRVEELRDAADVDVMTALADPARRDLAVAELYRRYERPLLAYARRRLDDRMRAEELVQETMTRLWTMADRFDSGRGNIDALVFTIASRVAIDIVRRQQRSIGLARHEPVSDPAWVDPTSSREVVMAVREALATLSAEHRTVIELSYFGGFSQSQVAARLGVPLGTIKTRCYWALRALHTALGDVSPLID